jgi:hypothetical protein
MSSNPNQKPAAPETFWQKLRNWVVGILIVLFILYIGVTRVLSFVDSVHNAVHDYVSDDVNGFYTAIKNQDYDTAYTYMTPLVQVGGSILKKADFIQQAKDIDAAKGPVKSYNIVNVAPGVRDGTKSVTVTVTRNGEPYDVKLGKAGINKYVASQQL